MVMKGAGHWSASLPSIPFIPPDVHAISISGRLAIGSTFFVEALFRNASDQVDTHCKLTILLWSSTISSSSQGTRDGDGNNPERLIPQSDGEILRALSCFCEIQCAFTRDKIVSLYERLKSTSDCLVDYGVEDYSVSSTEAPRLCSISDTNSSSSTFQYINPSLLSLDKDARGCGTRTSFPTPGSHRSPAPILPSTREPLNRTPSSGLDREASGAFRGQDPSHAATTAGGDFDSALRELEDMELGHSRPCDRTHSPDSPTQSSLGRNESSASETADASEDGASTGQLQTPAPTFDSVEGTGQDPSHRLAPNTPVGTANVEDAHRESPNAASDDNCPQTPEASAGSSGWSRGASRAEAAEANQTSKSYPSGRWPLKNQPTVEDAPDESERSAEDLSDDSDDPAMKAFLDDAHRFLDTSVDHENRPSSPNTNGPALASCRPESDKQHALPTNGKVARPQTCSEGASRNIRRLAFAIAWVKQRQPFPTGLKIGGKVVSLGILSYPTLCQIKKTKLKEKPTRSSGLDLAEFMEKYTKIWKSTGFWSSPSLDPSNYNTSAGGKGHAIWRYVEAMQAEGEMHYLKSRFADIMLYLEYVDEFNRQKRAGHPGQTAKTRPTDTICGTGPLPKATAKKARMSFHEHKLVGERWWWSGCFLGRGFILLCSQETQQNVWSP
ncbi:hypothetical protein N7532_010479 [Penicillium argentinense]|uniref:Uncharacterized protein n=1 Tax=Penicillium argentinense TaxID=1131581 RepID=A0A9W9JXZ6_9EURO|nr:uncharacterized protein N7532_010479 [Penicillium argentinense]KAJ5085708.1 hypothetical protein N7532_010479 [Penicillium argentinense]